MVLNVCVPPLEDQERQSRLDQVLSSGWSAGRRSWS